MKRISVLFVLLLCLIISFSSCSFEQLSGPEKALKDFESAFNNRDVDGIVKIFNPSDQANLKLQLELAKGVANIAGGFFGVDGIGDLFSTDLLSGVLGTAMEDCYLDLEVISEEYNEDATKAVVTVKMKMEDSENTEKLNMVKISNKWYLSDNYIKSEDLF